MSMQHESKTTPTFDYGYLHDHSRVTRFRETPVAPDLFLPHGRSTTLSLEGRWHFAIDPFNSGLRGEWYRDQGESEGDVGPPDYDFDNWDTISVPSCWNTYHDAYAYYEGAGWYVRTIEIGPVEGSTRAFLSFEGTSGETIVFVNGEFAGYHDNGGVPFSVNVTSHLRSGSNRIIVWVDNSRRSDAVPGDFFDWFNYGGIFRHVGLYIIPNLSIHSYFFSLTDDDRVAGTVDVSEAGVHQLRVTIGADTWILETDNNGHLDSKLPIKPHQWSLYDPYLYDITVELMDSDGNTVDAVRDSIGFRRISIKDTHVYLNDQRIFVKGVAVHEDHPERGRTLTTEDRLKIIAHCKELGANTIRLAHYPHDPEMSRLADQYGVLLWEEIPVYWHLQFNNEVTIDRARRQMQALILRDRNRASVVMWSIGNENPDSDGRLRFMKTIADGVRGTDPTRLITAACLVDVSDFTVTDRLADVVDVVSLNQYYGWYYPGIDSVPEILSSVADKPVMISEFGAGADFVCNCADPPKWSEEYQARVYADQFTVLKECDNLAGTFPWLLYDFASPRRLNSHQRGINRKGLVDRSRDHKKLAFDEVRRWYTQEF